MRTTMAWRFEGRVCVLVHTSAPPDRSEWHDYVRDLKRIGANQNQRVIVRSYGGGPDGAQRKLLTDVKGQREVPASILTNSVLARAVATAISWFIPQLKVFGVAAFEPACAFLELSPAERARASEALHALEVELGIRGLSSQPDAATSSE